MLKRLRPVIFQRRTKTHGNNVAQATQGRRYRLYRYQRRQKPRQRQGDGAVCWGGEEGSGGLRDWGMEGDCHWARRTATGQGKRNIASSPQKSQNNKIKTQTLKNIKQMRLTVPKAWRWLSHT